MSSPASVGRHPIHPMLVVFPIGLWTFSLVCDIIYIFGGRQAIWNTVALYTAIGGIIGAGFAAVPGLIDYFSIDDPQVKAIGTRHMLVNVSALVIFIVASLLRAEEVSAVIPFVLSICGIVLISIGGWLGGDLVYIRGMAVEPVEELIEKLEEQDEIRERRRDSLRRAG
jgi:uncharacterized membrane protein